MGGELGGSSLSMKDNVKVAVRMRPMFESELSRGEQSAV